MTSDARLLIEPASPFVPFEPEALPLPEPDDDTRPLLLDLLGSPERVVERLLEQEQLESTILFSLACVGGASSLFALVMMAQFGWMRASVAAMLAGVNALMALAAALGPIYATSVLLAARLPLARLVGTLLTASATGAMLLSALTPIPYFLRTIDAEWAGPLAMVGVFLVSGFGAGARIYKTLLILAERMKRTSTEEALTAGERLRVRRLAETAMAIFTFTTALAVWGFDAFAVLP